VARNGEIIFCDGKHRLYIAKILGIEKVPVTVNVWHKKIIDWVTGKIGSNEVTLARAIEFIFKSDRL